MRYEYLHDVEDLIEVFGNDENLDKGDLFYAINEYKDFKESHSQDEIYFEIDNEGDYAFLTEEEYEEITPNEPDEYVLSQNSKMFLKDELIAFLTADLKVNEESTLINLALAVNELSKENTIIPILNGKPSIELGDVLEKVAPSSHHQSVELVINSSAKQFRDDSEIKVILLTGNYMSLLGVPITSKKSLADLVNDIAETL